MTSTLDYDFLRSNLPLLKKHAPDHLRPIWDAVGLGMGLAMLTPSQAIEGEVVEVVRRSPTLVILTDDIGPDPEWGCGPDAFDDTVLDLIPRLHGFLVVAGETRDPGAYVTAVAATAITGGIGIVETEAPRMRLWRDAILARAPGMRITAVLPDDASDAAQAKAKPGRRTRRRDRSAAAAGRA